MSRIDYRETVCNLINDNNYKEIAEVGIWRGELSRRIINKCSPERLILVDPFSYNMNHIGNYICTMGEKERFQEELDIMAKEIEKLPAHFLRMNSTDAVEHVEDGSLDFVFIDAVHLYKYVVEDVMAWLPKIRKGGMISGDDYVSPKHQKDVRKAVKDTIGEVDNTHRVWFKKV